MIFRWQRNLSVGNRAPRSAQMLSVKFCAMCAILLLFPHPLFLCVYNRLQVLPWPWETLFMVCLCVGMEKLRTWATDCSPPGSELFQHRQEVTSQYGILYFYKGKKSNFIGPFIVAAKIYSLTIKEQAISNERDARTLNPLKMIYPVNLYNFFFFKQATYSGF